MSYADLIERLEKLKGPDREVDYEVGLATGYLMLAGACDDGTRLVTYFNTVHQAVWHGAIGACCPNFTASLDAAVALVERVLPWWQWGNHPHRGLRRAYVVKTSPLRPMPIMAEHLSPAIALLIATLKALDQQHD